MRRLQRYYMIDKEIEHLLRRWGVDTGKDMHIGYYDRCPYLKEYRPKGYRETPNDMDRPTVDRLERFICEHLEPLQVAILRIRYRQPGAIKHKRVAARKLGIPEKIYRERFNSAVNYITYNF